MIDRRVADDAVRLIGGERKNEYGTPSVALGRVAALWSAYLQQSINASDVARMMALLKVARMQECYKRDSFVDGIAYLLIAEELDRGSTD